MTPPTPLELPNALVSAILEGSAVLFLGAGASSLARHPRGEKVPTSGDLKNKLSDKFLGGKLKTRSLSHLAEMCISETNLFSVQQFVRDTLLPFEPADHHLIIPSFRWHALVTTNYDLILEKAYTNARNAKQQLVVFTKNGQQIDSRLKTLPNGVRYIKLHGSIDNINDDELPLILAKEQYVRYKKHRTRLFTGFQQIGYEFPIIFCGYSIDDQHIQEILFDLSDNGISRPRYYIVNPDLDEVERRYWESHRISCIDGTFASFLKSLEQAIPEHKRVLSTLAEGDGDSVRVFYRVSRATTSPVLKSFLSSDVDHVCSGMATSTSSPRQFYRGADTGWGPIESQLDVRRRITDNILVDAILADEAERQRLVDLHVIKGAAGHGKTTTLRRVAWEAAHQYERLCLFVREAGSLSAEALCELGELTKTRVFLFVDRAALHADDIHTVIGESLRRKIRLTILTAERDNEWNVRCGILDEYVAQDYPLRNLSEREIRSLLDKLERHESLGHLSMLPYSERVREFIERAERQLLVALHETTLGQPFEEIVKDEFDRLIPEEAKLLYLDICVLNRLSVPVRAGLIARVTGIRFEDFEMRFLKPLEHVVKSHIDRYVGDRMYSARHPHIADLVFQQCLADPEKRFDRLIRIMDGINVDYSSDNEAFRAMIRGRQVRELFSSHELGRRIYDRVLEIVGDDPHAHQQRGIFEMTHPGGNLRRAEESLMRALEIAPYDKSIQHTMGNLKRQQANETGDALLKQKLRQQSKSYLYGQVRGAARTSHGFHTLVLLLVDQLRDLLRSKGTEALDKPSARVVVELVRDIEFHLREGQQQFPDQERLLTAEATFREVLEEDRRAVEVLRTAFEKNPRAEWVGIRLSRRLVERGDISGARGVLTKCARENPGSKAVNFALAKFFIRHGDREERAKVLQLLRRSFSDGDTNFDAQFWFARENFLVGNLQESDKMFSKLGGAVNDPVLRNRIRGFILDESGRVKRFRATVRKREEAYFFATPEAFPRDVFCHASQVADEIWDNVYVGSVLELEIGFSMRGPAARPAVQQARHID